MKQATVFYIHPGKKKLHGIDVDTITIDGANDNAVADVLSKGYRRTPREALNAFTDAQKPVVKGPTAPQLAPQADEAPAVVPEPAQVAPQADEAPAVVPEPTQEPKTAPMPTIGDLLRDIERSPDTKKRPGRPKKVS